LGGIPKTNTVLVGLNEQARNDYERSKAEGDARNAQRNSGPDLAYTRGGDQLHSSPTSQARNDAGRGRQASVGGLPPGDRGPPKGISFGDRVDVARVQ
jgi:hypothetical protein